MNLIRTTAAVLVASGALIACGNGGNGGGNGGTGGTGGGGAGGAGGSTDCIGDGPYVLSLDITGEGPAADVRVDGERYAGMGANLLTLQGGRAEVEAFPVTQDAPIVRPIYVPTIAEETDCEEGRIDVTVTYAKHPTSERLWAATSNEAAHVVAYEAALLDTSATPRPSVEANATTAGGEGAPAAITFDDAGNLWAAYGAGELRRFPAAAIGAGGTPEADVVLEGSGFGAGIPGPTAIAFDATGNLWVAIGADDRVVRFTPAQIGTSGEPTPEVSIGGEGSGIDGPRGLAFDAAGNLWISTANHLIVRYDAARLGASGTEPPDRILAPQRPGGGGRLSSPAGLAFDEGGNLWAAFFGPNVIGKLEAGQIAGTSEADVEPLVQIEIGVTALLDGLAFDESGALWVALGEPGMGRYVGASLATSGNRSPDTLIGGTHVTDVAFFPAARELPLFHAVPEQAN